MAGKNNEEKKSKSSRRETVKSRRRPAIGGPVLLGAIDIGSTAVRMTISEFVPDNQPRVIEELNHPVSTGADTFRHGLILPMTIHSICNILENFLRVLDDYGVQQRRVVCSSSVREAANREILVDRIHHFFSLELEILDTVEESRLAYQALLSWLRENPDNYSMALNLGGGSTEIMILRGEDLQIGGTKRLGVSRLFHAAGQGSSQGRSEILRSMAANIVNSTRDVYQEFSIANLLLINRNLYRAFRSDPAATVRENDFVLPAAHLRERLRKATTLSLIEVGRHFNMGLSDAELLVPGMLILDQFIEASEVDAVTFTNTDMLSGVLIEMAMAMRGENPLMTFRRQMVRSARAVGEQYFYDRTHARVVTEFALRLFDALSATLDLDERDRLILEIASVLHDIGMYISERHHHRHSAYLIKWSDIVGVNEADRNVISEITAFHRKEMPSREFAEFMALSQRDRNRVRKLAGILRLADVLDRGHEQNVKSLRVEVGRDRLVLYVEIVGDLGVILDALPKKGDLLEQVTGMQIVLRRDMPKP